MLRRITLRRRAANVAVIVCGYMNRASAEPSAVVAKAHSPAGSRIRLPNGLPVFGLVELRWVLATPKM